MVTTVMSGVYCPVCESSVEAVAKFCLGCGNDLTVNGPITSTGHDLNQLKDVIRMRNDLSMAEKFDMIAKVEEGANPILLGIAAPADDEEDQYNIVIQNEEVESDTKTHIFGESVAAQAAMKAAVRGSDAWLMVKQGLINLEDEIYSDSMKIGMEASTHIHDVASGEHEGVDVEAMKSIPVLKPPKRSFCPKCGSDIHENTMLQWRKWRDGSGDVVSMQLEASMQAALIHLASHFQEELEKAKKNAGSDVDEDALRAQIEKEVRKELEKEFGEKPSKKEEKPKQKETKAPAKKASTAKKPAAKSSPAKKKAGGLFGAKRPKKKFEGDEADKPDWFLAEALDTIYDPHGTGKVLKPKTIIARSSEGNVRVQDIVRNFAESGHDGISELAKTSPLTDYIIEAYEAC